MGYIEAFGVDAGAALAALLLMVGAAVRPRWARPLLVAALGALAVRALAVYELASFGTVFVSRRLAVDLPLAAVAVLSGLVVTWFFRGSRLVPAVLRGAAGLIGVATLGLLLPGGVLVTGALVVLALGAAGLALPAARPRWVATGATVVAGLLLVGVAGQQWWGSRLPARYDLGALASADTGHVAAGAEMSMSMDHGHGTPVTVLKGPLGPPDVRVVLTAAPTTMLRAGRSQPAAAFNGTVPGPPIRARVGQLVLVHVCNLGLSDGVSVHWHGVDVPNAEDGVAGVTQDAIGDGGCHDYRFRPRAAGTYWYHAHQDSAEEVDRGLYGALVVDSAPLPPGATDLTVLDHGWRPAGGFLAGARWDSGARLETSVVAPGTPVRLRLVNTDRLPHRYRLSGGRFRVVGVDGTPVWDPSEVDDRRVLSLAAGGRYDLAFVMPAGGVRLGGLGDDVSLALLPAPSAAPPAAPTRSATSDLDLLEYGRPRAGADPARGDAAALAAARPDRSFELVIDQQLGFSGGSPNYLWSVNGQTFPRMPMQMVAAGDVVRMRLVNRSTAHHPMHLHGHHVLVLSRNGRAATGSPWWSDTLDVAPGQDFVVAFRADNPGIWMNHCHDLKHAADGFVLHLGYEGITTPFRTGSGTANRPE